MDREQARVDALMKPLVEKHNIMFNILQAITQLEKFSALKIVDSLEFGPEADMDELTKRATDIYNAILVYTTPAESRRQIRAYFIYRFGQLGAGVDKQFELTDRVMARIDSRVLSAPPSPAKVKTTQQAPAASAREKRNRTKPLRFKPYK